MRGNLSRIYVQTKVNASQHFGSTEFSQKRQLWDEVVLRNPKLMVLGKPGAGKTTLLQYIAVHCNEVNFQPKPVPVFVSLKIFAENARRADEIDLLSYIHKKYCRNHVSEQELKTLLIHGKLLFLLDGLDEVPEDELSQVIREIINWANEYSNNRFIVSCRKEHRAYKSKEMGSFIPCEVADFETTQIQEFIKNWFAQVTVYSQTERTTKANQLIEILSKTTNQRILELANTPLLLHLICLIFEERGDLPSKRAALYKEGIDLLLEKWNQFNRRNQIDVVELRTALRRIADITFEKGRSSFEEGEFLQLIENCPRALSDIEVLSGLLIKKGWKTYAFSHQTFQEYLKAEEIVAYPLDTRLEKNAQLCYRNTLA
jgi:predicted NACHT family NTPase